MVAPKAAAAALVIALAIVLAVAPLAAGDPPGNSPMSYVGPLPPFETKITFTIWASAWGGQGGVAKVELWYQSDGGAWQRYGDPIPYPWSWQVNTSLMGGPREFEGQNEPGGQMGWLVGWTAARFK